MEVYPPQDKSWDLDLGNLDPNWALNDEFSVFPAIPQVDFEHNHALGESAHIQTFHEGPKKCDCCPNWVEKPPTELPETAKEQYNKASVRLFRRKDHGGDYGTIGGLVSQRDDAVEIQSRIIADLIRPILAEVGRLAPEKDKIKFKAPFRDLYFAHTKILLLAQRHAPESMEGRHLKVLVDTMEKLFQTTSREVDDLLRRNTISYKYIWALFPKDLIVYSRVNDRDRIYQVVDVEESIPAKDSTSSPYWRIECRFLSFDGTNFGQRTKVFIIYKYTHVKRITLLTVYPLGCHKDQLLIEQKQLERGRRILGFQDMTQCEHEGIADALYDIEEDLGLPWDSRPHVSGRVIIDAYGLKEHNNDFHIASRPLEPDDQGEQEGGNVRNVPQKSLKDDSQRLPRITALDRRPSKEEQAQNREFLLRHPQFLLIMSPKLPGFSLKMNKWFSFHIDRLRDIQWNSAALESLILPEDHKSLLLTFVERHGEFAQQSKDVITGKGQGLVILLSGPAGTGKTLTCESIADHLRRPIYRLQTENLGSEPKQAGFRLSQAFEIALFWNAIVLLDEADSLMSKRSLENNARNEMVAVVLRHLEYYSGVIFMTTNLIDNIDDAVRSRCHMHLCYKPLSRTLREDLWRSSLDRLELRSSSSSDQDRIQIKLLPKELTDLAAWELNGREIKHAVRNVYLWCKYKMLDITLARIESAIQITAPFAHKVEEVLEEVEHPRKRLRPA